MTTRRHLVGEQIRTTQPPPPPHPRLLCMMMYLNIYRQQRCCVCFLYIYLSDIPTLNRHCNRPDKTCTRPGALPRHTGRPRDTWHLRTGRRTRNWRTPRAPGNRRPGDTWTRLARSCRRTRTQPGGRVPDTACRPDTVRLHHRHRRRTDSGTGLVPCIGDVVRSRCRFGTLARRARTTTRPARWRQNRAYKRTGPGGCVPRRPWAVHTIVRRTGHDTHRPPGYTPETAGSPRPRRTVTPRSARRQRAVHSCPGPARIPPSGRPRNSPGTRTGPYATPAGIERSSHRCLSRYTRRRNVRRCTSFHLYTDRRRRIRPLAIVTRHKKK